MGRAPLSEFKELKELIKDMYQKSKFINRKVRKGFTQRTQTFEFNASILCDLCEKSWRLCVKKNF